MLSFRRHSRGRGYARRTHFLRTAMICNWPAIGACVLPNAASWINGVRLSDSMTWYQTLKKPSWTPPNCVYMPVWTGLYTGMGYASYLVWRDAGKTFTGVATLPLTLYASQLAINWTFTEICFGRQNLKWGFYSMVLMDGAIAACGYTFYQVNRTAGLLMAPCLAWLTLATAITYRLYIDNTGSGSGSEQDAEKKRII